ncbi:DUF3850 domain-containing protein [Candidatus Macondimonas diazotrophica]|jgi:ASC-1-like (ASCH) protein|uniref:DUF3850 domain-containing protein n=1 Tax=Candidatus Macondimonas diazotrophica TaxID=2305248 RepID=A0A4Z0F6Y7_9GAMM|nr:DUF3850 domain-containing protein [Candidatus Macondimonas diazotrophica]TFZ81453.1 DUF3850 domain-containing protein [Candidatus Macondimonas diazotrophica]
MHHKLKILPCYFKAVVAGDKRFEIRNNTDRGFQKGDTIAFEEIEKGLTRDTLTGNAVHAKITCVIDYNQFSNQVVFGFEVIEEFSNE